MALPLLPLGIGLASASAGAAINYWLTNRRADPWEDRDVFNARMRDMQSLALALNKGFSKCKPFMSDSGQLAAWRGVRDSFSAFYRDTGELVYSAPNSAEIDQAKAYASKLYFWTGEYSRLGCGGPVADMGGKSPADPYSPPPPAQPTDWVSVVKWGAIGLGSLYVIRTISDFIHTPR